MRSPLNVLPLASITEPPRCFGARRDGGERKHAGIDLYATPLAVVVAMADCVIVRVADFYKGLKAVETRLYDGRIIRYCELAAVCVKPNQVIREGGLIGNVGKLPMLPAMLHLEMYGGTLAGSLTNMSNTPYFRRGDLLDPTSILADVIAETQVG